MRVNTLITVTVRLNVAASDESAVEAQYLGPMLLGLALRYRGYRGTSVIRNSASIGLYSSPMPRDLW